MLAVRVSSRARSSRLWTLRTPEKGRASARMCVAPLSSGTHASESAYGRAAAAAREDPERFWGEAGSHLKWFQPWSKTVHVEDPVFPNWWVSRGGATGTGQRGRARLGSVSGYRTWRKFAGFVTSSGCAPPNVLFYF